MKETPLDYIIIGQGLAGTCVAVQLLKLDKKILVIDNPHQHSSSKVAAGVFNPITGRRSVLTWKAKEVFEYFPSFYKDLENELNESFFYNHPLFKVFQNISEQNDWINKPKSEVPGFVPEVYGQSQYGEYIEDSLGGLMLSQTGYLDVSRFLLTMREYFKYLNIYEERDIDLAEINWVSPFTVGDLKSKKLILCMGYNGCKGTPFGETAFHPVKGELIEIETLDKLPSVIFNGPVFILPQEGKIVKVGATYDFVDKTTEITSKARQELIEKLDSFLKVKYLIRRQWAGIRPSSFDRRPVTGEHPEIANLGILNGLGTKGVSLAPYISKLLIDYFENGKELDSGIDIKRFFK